MDRWRQLPKDIRMKILTSVPDQDLESGSLAGRSMRDDIESSEHFKLRNPHPRQSEKERYTSHILCIFTADNEHNMPIDNLRCYKIVKNDRERILYRVRQFIRENMDVPVEQTETQSRIMVEELMRDNTSYDVLTSLNGRPYFVYAFISPRIEDIDRA